MGNVRDINLSSKTTLGLVDVKDWEGMKEN